MKQLIVTGETAAMVLISSINPMDLKIEHAWESPQGILKTHMLDPTSNITKSVGIR